MNKYTLKASRRDVAGKKTRFLRKQGVTPAHLYGHGVDSLALQCDTVQLQKVLSRLGNRLLALDIDGDGQSRSVFVREVQSDAISRQLLHVDFYQVKEDELIEAEIPLVLAGESQLIKGKTKVLIRGVSSLHVKSLPKDLPPQIEVDLNLLERQAAIYVKNIALPPGVTLKTDPDQLIAKLSEARKVEVEEARPAVVAAPDEGGAAAAAGAGQAAPKAEAKTEVKPGKTEKSEAK
ncbi:MAG: 50S ribosomal protein L25 [Chloroflexi bacterium]|nr:50S ribosomal protein L25 [Chloroflexota bacterium]